MRDGFRREDDRIAQFAHHQRTDAERITARHHAGRGQHDQRIGALNPAERVDELV
jgi:hypothetical protein